MKTISYNNGTIKRVLFYIKSEKARDSHFLKQRFEVYFFSFILKYCFDFKKQETCFLKGTFNLSS